MNIRFAMGNHLWNPVFHSISDNLGFFFVGLLNDSRTGSTSDSTCLHHFLRQYDIIYIIITRTNSEIDTESIHILFRHCKFFLKFCPSRTHISIYIAFTCITRWVLNLNLESSWDTCFNHSRELIGLADFQRSIKAISSLCLICIARPSVNRTSQLHRIWTSISFTFFRNRGLSTTPSSPRSNSFAFKISVRNQINHSRLRIFVCHNNIIYIISHIRQITKLKCNLKCSTNKIIHRNLHLLPLRRRLKSFRPTATCSIPILIWIIIS